MTAKNVYINRATFLQYLGTSVNVDSVDDKVIDTLLESVSRRIDKYTGGRTFYPRIVTNKFDVPDDDMLLFDDDLLEVITFTNGDDTVIVSTQYNLLSANVTPYWALEMKPSASVYLTSDSSSDDKQVIDVLGVWGCKSYYSREGFTALSTLSAAITTTTATSISLATIGNAQAGDILRVENELMLVDVRGNSPQVVRGWNGSTAATHLVSTAVTIWNTQAEIAEAAAIMAVDSYHKREGQGVTGNATITAGGIILAPESIPNTAREILHQWRRFQ